MWNTFTMQQLLVILLGVLVTSQTTQAQSGYNYVRPELAIGGSNNIQPTGSTAVRPVVPASFPTANTAYGVTGAAGSVNPTTAFGAVFKPNAGATVPASAYVGTSAASAGQKLPALQPQRPATGIYGNIAVPSRQPQQQYSSGTYDSTDGDYSAIPGVPGVNYPIYAEVPPTNFDCAQQPLPGYYSDVEAQCQVFHICALNRTYSFLCPNGTIFSQATLVCVWWNQYDCVSAPSLYANNAFIYDYGTQGAAPSNSGASGYPTGVAQVGIGGGVGTRSQSNFQAAANAARTSSAPTTAAIYGSSGLRPTVAAFSTATGNTVAGRYTPTPTAQATGPSFPTGASATPYGATGIRSDGYSTAIQESAYSGAQITPKNSNREYLPPSQVP